MKILHSADIQVKNREKNLFRATEKTLKNIEKVVIDTKAEIFIIAGDLFEYAEPNDSERRLIYNFLSRIANIDTLLELVIITGNHDLIKDKKQIDTMVGYNPINTFTDLINKFNVGNKILYLSESKYYNSRVSDKIQYLAYSLEDGMDVDLTKAPGKDESRQTICLFHDMLKDYVDSVKLPLRKDIYEKLKSIDEFPANTLITAGDIHKNLTFKGIDGQLFIYPGSPMEHTHSEGTYIDVSTDIKLHNGERKVIKQYEFDDVKSPKDFVITEHQLEKFVTYNTITLDSKQDYKTVIAENLKNVKLQIGSEVTFVKVKSANIFVKYEQDIFNILSNHLKSDDRLRFRIEFDYDKFVQTDKAVNNEVIQKILDEKKDELNIDSDDLNIELDTSNIDDLILSDNHLKTLFKSILDAQMKKVKTDDDIEGDDISKDVMAIFERELIEFQSNSKRYNILFEEIETTTGFMGLIANKIDLNIPGLARIFGTNGIGKTTLYRMIRWVISGEVFEGMARNTVAKNNLIVFNKNLIHKDTVDVKLRVNINNLKVVATRIVTRKWKNNTTDEQKSDINWKDYVSAVERNFIIDVETPEGDKKQFTGEQAEKSIMLWFGQTMNNILFINYPKLESLLQTPSDKLNEMILNFIGVDYLKQLEGNLDQIKAELATTSKPKRNKEDIRTSIIDGKILIKRAEKELLDVDTEITKIKTKIVDLEEKIKSKTTEMINMGNITDIIIEKESKFNEIKTFIDTFEPKTKKDKIVFDKIEPIINQTEIDNLQSQIDLINKEIEELKQSEIIQDNKRTEIFNKLDVLINEKLDELKNQKTSKLQLSEANKEKIAGEFKLVVAYIDGIIKQLEDRQANSEAKIQEIKSVILLNQEQIRKNNDNLESGICDKCKRPFAEDFEAHKEQLIKENAGLLVVNTEQSELLQPETELLLKIKETIKLFNVSRDLAMANSDEIIKTEKLQKGCAEFFANICTHKEAAIEINKQIQAIDILIYDWQSVVGLKSNIDFVIPETINCESLTEIITNLKGIVDEKSKISELISTKNNYSETKSNNIIQIKNDYIVALQEYQKLLNVNIAENNSIGEFNKTVDEHNNQILIKKSELGNISTELSDLKINKLPVYVKHQTELSEYRQSKQELDVSLDLQVRKESDLKIANVRLTNELAQFEKEYTDYLAYLKNDIVWKIYSKLIKDNFKEIVFDYYRTFLNQTLNILLGNVNFKLFWNQDSELYMISYKNGICSYQPVQQSSGMETTFLGLALVYTMHLLNVKNSVSHIFIDEISGTLNDGEDLTYDAENYQELMVLILSKFKDKTVFIVDHNIKNLFETVTYEVQPDKFGSKFVIV